MGREGLQAHDWSGGELVGAGSQPSFVVVPKVQLRDLVGMCPAPHPLPLYQNVGGEPRLCGSQFLQL